MSFLTCKQQVFMFTKQNDTLATSGSADPDSFTHAQIDAAINGGYRSIAVDNKCIEKSATITVSTASKEYSSAIPSDYIDTIAVTSSSLTKAFLPACLADSDLYGSSTNYQWYSIFGENIVIFDATQAGSDTSLRHTYWAIPASLTSDSEAFLYPLRNWERLIALRACTDLLAKDMSQSAIERLPFIQTLYADELMRFQNQWSVKVSRNSGILDNSRMIGRVEYDN